MSQTGSERAVDPRAPVVLVVDDDAAIRTVVCWQPALVVLDPSLPRLGRLDVLRSVRGARALLVDRVWTSSSEWLGEATVTEHVHRLRLELERDLSHPELLRTGRGVGCQVLDSP